MTFRPLLAWTSDRSGPATLVQAPEIAWLTIWRGSGTTLRSSPNRPIAVLGRIRPPSFSVRPVLIHAGAVSEAVADSGLFARVIDAAELLGV